MGQTDYCYYSEIVPSLLELASTHLKRTHTHPRMKINTISSGCHQSIIALLLRFNKPKGWMNGKRR